MTLSEGGYLADDQIAHILEFCFSAMQHSRTTGRNLNVKLHRPNLSKTQMSSMCKSLKAMESVPEMAVDVLDELPAILASQKSQCVNAGDDIGEGDAQG